MRKLIHWSICLAQTPSPPPSSRPSPRPRADTAGPPAGRELPVSGRWLQHCSIRPGVQTADTGLHTAARSSAHSGRDAAHCSTADTAGQVNLPGPRDRHHSRVWIIYHLTRTRKPTLYCLDSAQLNDNIRPGPSLVSFSVGHRKLLPAEE